MEDNNTLRMVAAKVFKVDTVAKAASADNEWKILESLQLEPGCLQGIERMALPHKRVAIMAEYAPTSRAFLNT